MISILSHLNDNDESVSLPPHSNIHFLYSTRLPQTPTNTTPKPASSETTVESILSQVLFLPRLRQITQSLSHSARLRVALDLFVTDGRSGQPDGHPVDSLLASPPHDFRVHPRRISGQDLQDAIFAGSDGSKDDATRRSTVCYVCGPPTMTDETVNVLKEMLGGGEDASDRVLYEKWW